MSQASLKQTIRKSNYITGFNSDNVTSREMRNKLSLQLPLKRHRPGEYMNGRSILTIEESTSLSPVKLEGCGPNSKPRAFGTRQAGLKPMVFKEQTDENRALTERGRSSYSDRLHRNRSLSRGDAPTATKALDSSDSHSTENMEDSYLESYRDLTPCSPIMLLERETEGKFLPKPEYLIRPINYHLSLAANSHMTSTQPLPIESDECINQIPKYSYAEDFANKNKTTTLKPSNYQAHHLRNYSKSFEVETSISKLSLVADQQSAHSNLQTRESRSSSVATAKPAGERDGYFSDVIKQELLKTTQIFSSPV